MKALKLYTKKIDGEWKIPRTIQDAIPLDAIERTGIARRGKTYSQTYHFSDINYSLADEPEKERIFRQYSSLLNSLRPDCVTQITLINHKINLQRFRDQTMLKDQEDELDQYRQEVNKMLREKTQQASGIVRDRYITITSDQSSFDEARSFFARQTSELRVTMRGLGSTLMPLDATERLRIFHDFYRSGYEEHAMLDISRILILITKMASAMMKLTMT
jgi:hypothetical protein